MIQVVQRRGYSSHARNPILVFIGLAVPTYVLRLHAVPLALTLELGS